MEPRPELDRLKVELAREPARAVGSSVYTCPPGLGASGPPRWAGSATEAEAWEDLLSLLPERLWSPNLNFFLPEGEEKQNGKGFQTNYY